jgi:predicted nucleotidyltransferase/uncharacterized protein (UPF0332 family)
MVKKKKTRPGVDKLKKKTKKKSSKPKNKKKKSKIPKDVPTLQIKKEREIAMDFATKVYKRYDKLVKSVVLFGSTAKQEQTTGSDVDIIIIIDDVAVSWDQELIAWYRQELEKLIKSNSYQQTLHINTVKLSTWWEDLMRGDPVVINVLRYGEAMIDLAGFFNPLKYLLLKGKIRSTPEAIYNALQRAPMHIARSKMAEVNSVEGLYWAMVDSAHAALIAANIPPASPEHIAVDLKETFVDPGKLKMKYVVWYRDLLMLHKKIAHGEVRNLKGVEIDAWQDRAEEFLNVMAQLVKDIVE